MADRKDILAALKSAPGLDLSPDSGHIDLSPDTPMLGTHDPTNPWGLELNLPTPRPVGGDGFLGPLGQVIDIIDTPRAAIMSTVKEVTDLVQGEGFSGKDWWNQTSDNYMFGDLLQDEGWGTGTGWDIALGLPIDILLDPVTYALSPLKAAGMLARGTIGAKGVAVKMQNVAKASSKAAYAADKAGDAAGAAKHAAKADEYNAAAAAVVKNNAIQAAPKKILEEMGFDVAKGMTFSVPLTGRVGRKVVERPLDRVLGGLLSKVLDPRRIKQLPKFMIDDAGFDLWSNTAKAQKNRDLVQKAMYRLKRGENIDNLADAATMKSVRQAAKMANQMAVDVPGVLIPGTYGLATKVALGPGRLWGTAMVRTPFMDDMHKAFASGESGAVKRMMRGTGLRAKNLTDEDRLVGLAMWDNLQTALTAERTFGVQFGERVAGLRQTIDEINESLVAAGRDEITPEDMMRWGQIDDAANMTPEARRLAGLEEVFGPGQGEVLPSKWEAQIKIKEFWEGVRKDFNAALAREGEEGFGSIDEMLDDFYVARFIDLETEIGKKIVDKGRWTPPADARHTQGLRGSPTKLREYKPGETFLGKLLVSPAEHPQGLSIVDQMRVIGKDVVGPEFRSMYSEQFWDVADRYGKVMKSRARHQRWINELENSAILQRGTMQADGIAFKYDTDVVNQLEDLIKAINKERGKFQKDILSSNEDIEKLRETAVASLDQVDEVSQAAGAVLVRLNNQLTDVQTVLNEFEEIAGVAGFSPKAKQYLLDLLDGKMATRSSKEAALEAEILEEIVEFIEPLAQKLAKLRQAQNQLQETIGMAHREGVQVGATPRNVAWDDMLEVPTKDRGYATDLQNFLTKLDAEITDLEKFMRYVTGNLHTSALADETVEMMETLVKLSDDIKDPKFPLVISGETAAEGVLRPKRRLSPERMRQLRQPRGTAEPQLVQRREGGKFAEGKEIKSRAAYNYEETIESPNFQKITIEQFTEMDLPSTIVVEQVYTSTGEKIVWQVEHSGRTFDSRTAAMDHVYEELGYFKVPRVFRNEKGQIVSQTSKENGHWVRKISVPKESPIRKTKKGNTWADLFERMGNLSNELNAEQILVTNQLDDVVERVANLRNSLEASPVMMGLNEDLARLDAYINTTQGTRQWFIQLANRGRPNKYGWSGTGRPKGAEGKSDYWLGKQRGMSDEDIAHRYQTRAQPRTKGGKPEPARKGAKVAPGETAAARWVSGVVEGDLNDAHRQFDIDRLRYYADEGIEPPDLYVGARQEHEDLLKVKNQINEQIAIQQNLIDEAVQKAKVAEQAAYQARANQADDIQNYALHKAEADARKLQLEAEVASLRESGSIVDFFRSAPTPDEAILRVLADRGLYSKALDAYGEAQSNFLLSYRGMQQTLTPGGQSYVAGGLSETGFQMFEEALMAGAKLHDFDEVGKFLKGYRQLANWWKSQAVTTPGFIIRNLMGGMWINSMVAGVEFGTHSKVIGMTKAAASAGNGDVLAGMRQLAASDGPVRLEGISGLGGARKAGAEDFRDLLELMESGSVGSGQSWSEIITNVDQAAVLRPYQRRQGKLGGAQSGLGAGWTEGTWKPWSADFKMSRAIRSQNERAEFVLRASVGMDTLAKGGDVASAYRNITKYHFDYGDITNVERRIKDVIPFYTWQKNVIPVLLESMGRKPQSWGRLLQVKKELELHSPQQGLVPDYFGENMGIRLPFKIPGIKGGRVYALPDLPFRDFQRYLKEPTSPIRGPLESAFPWVKLPAEMWATKQTFADIPFMERYQQVPSWGKIPGLMPILGGLGKAKKAKDGTWVMKDNDIYAVDQFVPFFGRMRRMLPNEEAKQRRLMTTWVSTIFGGGFRVNDPFEKRSQFIRDQKKFANDMRDILDIETRRV